MVPNGAKVVHTQRIERHKSEQQVNCLAVAQLPGYNAPTIMSALLDELEKQSRLLTPQEKATLARILIEDLDPLVDSAVDELWIAEAQRRYQAYLKGEMETHPGDEVMPRARNRLK